MIPKASSYHSLAVGFILLSLIICGQANENSNSPSTPNKSPFFGVQNENLTLFIEEVLNQNEAFTSMLKKTKDESSPYDIAPKTEVKDCSSVSKILGKTSSSIYITINPIRPTLAEVINCEENEEGLEKIILVGKRLIENEQIMKKMFESSFFVSVFGGLENIKYVVSVKLCEYSYFDVESGECVEGRERRALYTTDEQTFIDTFQNYLSDSKLIPEAIALTIDNAYSQILIEYLVDQLYIYSNNTSTFTTSDFDEVYGAILLIMMQERDNDEYVNKTVWDKLFSIASIALNVTDPQNYDFESENNMTELTFLYLEHYQDLNSDDCAINSFYMEDYPQALKNSFDLINSFYKLVVYESNIVIGPNITINYPNSAAGLSKYISVTINASSAKDHANCACDFCDSDKEILSVITEFVGFGYGTDVFGIKYYSINTTSNSLPVEVSASDSCFSYSLNSNFYLEGETSAFVDANNYFKSKISNIIITGDKVDFNVNDFGLFMITVDCSEGFALSINSSSLADTTCDACQGNCLCECAGDCDSCSGNFNFNETTDSCNTCTERFDGENCTECLERFDGENCTECSERFDGENCTECADHFTGENCIECAGNFVGENCTECLERFDGENCTECSERFDGENCTECADHFTGENCIECAGNFVGENCTECAGNFVGNNCNECDGHFAGENCTECADHYAGKNCTECAGHFTGENCTKCKGNFAGENCTECAGNFKGENCTECAGNFVGENCTECFGNFAGENCTECAGNFAGENCTECTGNYVGENCTDCAEHFTGENCTDCTGNFVGENCSECAGNFAGENCTECDENFEGENCTDCEIGFNGANCDECEAGYINNGTEKCSICDDGYGRNESLCSPCEDNCLCSYASGCSDCIKGFVYNNSGDDISESGFCTKGYSYVKAEHILSKLMSSGFTSIQITLNQDINITSTNCSDYFVNSAVLGGSAKCSVTGSRILNIILGDDFTVTDQTDLELAETFLLDTDEVSLNTITININYTADYSIRSVIAGVQTLSDSCASSIYTIEFSGFNSYGSLKKRFNFSWEYYGNYTLSSTSGEDTYTYSITIDLNTSNTGYFNVNLTVDDGLSNSVNQHTVTVSSSKRVKFELDAGTDSSFKASDDISISTIITDACTCKKGYNYKWEVEGASNIKLDQSKLRIPAKTFSTYGDKTISLDIECKDKSVLGLTSSTISIKPSSLVVNTNRADQSISDSLNLKIDGSGSFDPDGFSITYEWSSDPDTVLSSLFSSSLPKLHIPASGFSSLTSFVVVLKVTSTGGGITRVASKSHKFTVLESNPLSLSLEAPSKKVTISSQVTINGRISGAGDYPTYTWSITSGPTVAVQPYAGSLVIAAGSLESGASYSFKLVVTSGSHSIEAATIVNVNAVPICDSALKVDPTTGTKSVFFTVSAFNCVDGDNQDNPLSFYLSIRKLGRYSSFKTNIRPSTTTPFPCGTDKVRFDVCDTLSDCFVLTADISVNCPKRSLKEDSIDMQEYLESKLYFDTFEALTVALFSAINDEALLDLIWQDFTEYVDEEFKTIFLSRQIVSTILSLIEQPQNEKLMVPRFPKYINFLADHLSKSSSIDSLTQEYLKDIAQRLTIVDASYSTMQLSLNVLKSLGKFFSIPGVPYTQSTAQINLYQIETTLSELSPIALGPNVVTLNDAGFDLKSMIIVEAASLSSTGYSDKVQIRVSSKRYLASSGIEEYETEKEMDGQNEACVIALPFTGIKAVNVDCLSEDSETKCEVLYTYVNIATIRVYKSGTYSVGYKETESSSVSVSGNLYVVISLILLCVLSMPFMLYLDKLYPYVIIPTVPITSISDRTGSKFGADTYYNGENKPLSSRHLLLSLLVTSPDFSRNKKLMIFMSNVVFGVLLQTVLLEYNCTEAVAAGVISAMVVMPLSLILVILLRGQRESSVLAIIGMVLAVAMMIASVVGVYMMTVNQMWYVAFLCGFATEVVVSESVLMGLRKVFNA